LDNSLPKKIWFLWLQGLESAPLLVRKCYESWVMHNTGWEVIVLNEGNINNYMPPVQKGTTSQALSDILRVNLLAKHGGVWVDATCFCMKPLDEWLFHNLSSGFFAFDRPGPDRMLSSWFMAAEKYNYIASTYCNKVNLFWAENPGMQYIENSKWKKLNKQLQRMKRQIWFSKLTTRILKVHTYFWFHYLFEQIYLHDDNFKEMWDATPKISADIPHTLLFAGIYSPLTLEIKAHIDNKVSPVYKLSWKDEPPADLDGTVMGYLYNAPQTTEG
jgi:Capsular polysaccharide synthesis protein